MLGGRSRHHPPGLVSLRSTQTGRPAEVDAHEGKSRTLSPIHLRMPFQRPVERPLARLFKTGDMAGDPPLLHHLAGLGGLLARQARLSADVNACPLRGGDACCESLPESFALELCQGCHQAIEEPAHAGSRVSRRCVMPRRWATSVSVIPDAPRALMGFDSSQYSLTTARSEPTTFIFDKYSEKSYMRTEILDIWELLGLWR